MAAKLKGRAKNIVQTIVQITATNTITKLQKERYSSASWIPII